jgi:uridine phosphorylase
MSEDAHRLEPALMTADALFEWRRTRGQSIDLPPADVILTHQLSLFRFLTPRFRSRALRGFLPELRPLPRVSGRVAVAGNFGVGGAAAAMTIEELAAAGVRRVVAIDVAAAVAPGFASGEPVLARTAVCGDGTSRHYAFGAETVYPDEELLQRVAVALEGENVQPKEATVWSTDAPFRETAAAVQSWRDAGAALVDMETAALYAAAAALGVAAAAILVVADELIDGWRPPADMSAVQAALRRSAAAAIRSLA